jgi:hypothetical protein
MAVRFDPARLDVIGQPFPVVENVMQAFSANSNYNTGPASFDVSDSGGLIYAAGGTLSDSQNSLVWVDQKGGAQIIGFLKLNFFATRLSPDGRRIAYTTENYRQVGVYDIDRGTNTLLVTEGVAAYVTWTPDGKRLIFDWGKSAESNLWWRPFDGTAPMEKLSTNKYMLFPGSWAPDKRTLALVENNPNSGNRYRPNECA